MAGRVITAMLFAGAIYVIASVATVYHPLALASQSLRAADCGDWGIETCMARD